ncbi:RNA polymerase sigma factor [Wenzhouxiangella sp. XN24]|uniref:sigma-70 family RNA polymerase sigma factor n=1 Tax=Wenzhouxiangella sp. XN24 TaxID=2713569 RepID=UPI0013EA6257|nr:RNA polymerase sigma factor [Wenzhouxiangella sp. XN24]
MKPGRGRGDRPVGDSAQEFTRLLEPLIPTLFRHAYRWTAARDQAEDLVQELLVRLYPQMAKLAELERVEPWALRVMYRIFVDQHRRSRNSPVRPMHEAPATGAAGGEDFGEVFADHAPQPGEALEREHARDALAEAWGRLNPDQRAVIALHDVEGYRLEELATLLEVPVGTLKSRLHRARATLREILATEPFAAVIREQLERP